MSYKKNIALITFIFFVLVVSCDHKEDLGSHVALTSTETLDFLVGHADLIAIVQIVGGTEMRRITSSVDMPQKAKAIVLSVIIGVEDDRNIILESVPKYSRPGAIKSTVLLRNGRYLAFLNQDDSKYKPTTMFSLLEVSNDKVFPIWKQSGSNREITTGYLLNNIIDDVVEKKIKKPSKRKGGQAESADKSRQRVRGESPPHSKG